MPPPISKYGVSLSAQGPTQAQAQAQAPTQAPAQAPTQAQGPIVAIDLIVNNEEGKILLGKKNNTWYVPGGKLNMNETFPYAVRRISLANIGKELEYKSGLGVYHQMYPQHNLHYITFAVSVIAPKQSLENLTIKYNDTKWWNIEDIVKASDVHEMTKNYFVSEPRNLAYF